MPARGRLRCSAWQEARRRVGAVSSLATATPSYALSVYSRRRSQKVGDSFGERPRRLLRHVVAYSRQPADFERTGEMLPIPLRVVWPEPVGQSVERNGWYRDGRRSREKCFELAKTIVTNSGTMAMSIGMYRDINEIGVVQAGTAEGECVVRLRPLR